MILRFTLGDASTGLEKKQERLVCGLVKLGETLGAPI